MLLLAYPRKISEYDEYPSRFLTRHTQVRSTTPHVTLAGCEERLMWDSQSRRRNRGRNVSSWLSLPIIPARRENPKWGRNVEDVISRRHESGSGQPRNETAVSVGFAPKLSFKSLIRIFTESIYELVHTITMRIQPNRAIRREDQKVLKLMERVEQKQQLQMSVIRKPPALPKN
jgi:hypothetical protein